MRTSDRYSTYPESAEEDVSVFSWNVLAPSYDDWCRIEWEGVRLPELRRWLTRFAACDVICLQEVDVAKSLPEISAVLGAHGFTAVVQERKGFPVVNATFFKASRARLLWSQSRSRVLVVGLALSDGRELCVANVHFEAGGGESNERQRKAQLASLLQRVSGSVVVCGDFNSPLDHESPLRVQLTEAGLMRAPTDGITLAHKTGNNALDHIWASEDLVTRLVLGSSPEALAEIIATGIPDATHPSDHLPVAATFRFRRERNDHGQQALKALAVDVPASPGEEMRQEWIQICWYTPVAGGKREAREHRQLEAAFFELLNEEDVASLRKWRDAASKAAKSIVATAVGGASAAVRAAEITSSTIIKPFDPGGEILTAESYGGA